MCVRDCAHAYTIKSSVPFCVFMCMYSALTVLFLCVALTAASVFFLRAQWQWEQTASVPGFREGCSENSSRLLSETQRTPADFSSIWSLCQHSQWVLHTCTQLQINRRRFILCPACMFSLRIKIPLSSYLCRSAAGAGGSHRGSSTQLCLTAAAQPKTPPAFTAPHGPGLPEPPPASTQWHHCYPHTGTHT